MLVAMHLVKFNSTVFGEHLELCMSSVDLL